MTCFGNDIQNSANYGTICKLTIADSSKLLETECYDEKYTEESFGETKKSKRLTILFTINNNLNTAKFSSFYNNN